MIFMNFKIILSFVIGGAVGAAVATKIASDRYEKIMNEETEELRRYASSMDSTEPVMPDEAKDLAEQSKNKPSITNYAAMYKNNMNPAQNEYAVQEEPVIEYAPDTEVIDLNDFAAIDGYSTVLLTYYANGVLADEDDTVLPLERIGGEESLSHFDEDGILYVRNNQLMVDYEIDYSEDEYGRSN